MAEEEIMTQSQVCLVTLTVQLGEVSHGNSNEVT